MKEKLNAAAGSFIFVPFWGLNRELLLSGWAKPVHSEGRIPATLNSKHLIKKKLSELLY